MPERNKELVIEIERLEKGFFTGQVTIHFLKGVSKIIEWPKKPVRKELGQSEMVNQDRLYKTKLAQEYIKEHGENMEGTD